jgi:hypothetical protein
MTAATAFSASFSGLAGTMLALAVAPLIWPRYREIGKLS